MELNKNKLLIIGLPKSGTSTLATMFRMLGYSVAGPNSFSSKNELFRLVKNYDVLQDYPWCFEYASILDKIEMKVIVLQRNSEDWYSSFIKSYGGEKDNYLAFEYMKLSKKKSKAEFKGFHTQFYIECQSYLEINNIKYLNLDLSELSWKIICEFVDKPIPKNLFGQSSKLPRVNSKNYKRKGFKHFLLKRLKKLLLLLLGNKYTKFTSFIYRNKSY
jgi:hypothetical protein